MTSEFNDLLKRARESSDLLKALSHELRLMVLCHLGSEERTVQELEALLRTSQSNLSQHLAKLRHKNILAARKEGNQVYYSVKDPRALNLIQSLQGIVCRKPGAKS